MDILKTLFAPIEKLITEHGSASILREHINLLKEKFSFLEKENSSFKEKSKELESQLDNATKEIKSLKKLNQELQGAAYQEKEKLDEVPEQILQQFFDAERDLPLEHFTSSLSLKANIVKHNFDILLNLEYINYASAGLDLPGLNGFTQYSITAKGRKYIIENT